MAIFGPKPYVNPFGKMSIFRLFDLFLFIAQKGVFFFQNMIKDIFVAYYAKKKVGKKAIFAPKPLVNLFGKMAIFRLFDLLVFIDQKGIFSFQNIIKDIFLAYIALTKRLENCPFLDLNHGLTPLGKCQLQDFFNFLFLQPRKAFFLFQNIIKDIFLAYIA